MPIHQLFLYLHKRGLVNYSILEKRLAAIAYLHFAFPHFQLSVVYPLPTHSLVPRTGVEPVISSVRGRRPGPLDERGIPWLLTYIIKIYPKQELIFSFKIAPKGDFILTTLLLMCRYMHIYQAQKHFSNMSCGFLKQKTVDLVRTKRNSAN